MFTYLFAAISKEVLKRIVKRVELNPVELTFAGLKEIPDELALFVTEKTIRFKKIALIYFAVTEAIDVAILLIIKDAVLPCRLSIGLMTVSLVALAFVAKRYLDYVRDLNDRVNAELEYIKVECEMEMSRELAEDSKVVPTTDGENEDEIANGKAFLSNVVQDQLVNEKLPDDYFG